MIRREGGKQGEGQDQEIGKEEAKRRRVKGGKREGGKEGYKEERW